MNRRYAQWYAQPVETMLGRPVRDATGDAVYYSIESYLKLALSGSRVSFPATLTYPDGVTRDITANYFPDEDADGAVRGVFVMVSTRQNDAARRWRKVQESASRLSCVLSRPTAPSLGPIRPFRQYAMS